MASTANRIIKNTGFLYAKMGITMFISLYTTRLILNSLGASDFGIFNIVGGAIAMLGFLNGAMASASQRFMSFAEGAGNTNDKIIIFNISYFLHCGISFIVGLLLVICGFVFFNGVLNIPDDRLFASYIVYGSLVVSTVFSVMSVPYEAILNAHENMRYYSLVGILESLLKLAVAFACVYTSTGDKLIIYGILMACIPIVIRIIMRIYCHKNYEECVISYKHFNYKKAHEMAAFAGWSFIGSIGGLVGNYGQGIIANHFFGVVINAATGIVTQLNGQMMTLTYNMQKALNPIIVKKVGAGNYEESLNWAIRGCRFSVLLIIWIIIPVCAEVDSVLKFWLKDVPQWTSVFLVFQLLRGIVEQTYSGLSTAVGATGNIKEIQVINSFLIISALFIVAGLDAIGFPPYTQYLTLFCTALLQSFAVVYFCHKYCGITYKQYVTDIILPTALIAAIMYVAAISPRLFISNDIIRVGMAFLCSWIALVFVSFFVLHKEEKDYIRQIFIKIKQKL